MPYVFLAFGAVVVFAIIHLYADQTRGWNRTTRGIFLSMSGSIGIVYVFLSLLPKLAINDLYVRNSLQGIFPYFEKHVYLMALIGFLFFLMVGRNQEFLKGKASFYFSLFSYAFFNFLVGYAVVDKNNPEVRPLFLFTIAIGLHYFMMDFALNQTYPRQYKLFEKWILIFSLFLGWLIGVFFTLSALAIALVSAFLAGGMLMNVMNHEVKTDNPKNLSTFLITAAIYTVILLALR